MRKEYRNGTPSASAAPEELGLSSEAVPHSAQSLTKTLSGINYGITEREDHASR